MFSGRRTRRSPDGTPHATSSGDPSKPVRRSGWKIFSQLLLTSTVASACTTTSVQTAPIPEQVRAGQKGEVRLTMRSGELVTMFDPRVVQDSIVGFAQPAASQPSPRVAVARADVQSVAATEVSVGKTVAASLVGGLATLTLIVGTCLAQL